MSSSNNRRAASPVVSMGDVQPSILSSTSRHSSSGGGVASSMISASATRPQPSEPERTADARKAFLSSLGVAASHVDADLQSRAKTLHENAQALTKQERQLQETTKSLAKENAETEKWLAKSKKKLAEIDDLLNADWNENDQDSGIDDDLDDLEAMLDMIETSDEVGRGPVTDENGEASQTAKSTNGNGRDVLPP